ncbi:MAG: hypothetical protein WCP97_03930 [bacterium]
MLRNQLPLKIAVFALLFPMLAFAQTETPTNTPAPNRVVTVRTLNGDVFSNGMTLTKVQGTSHAAVAVINISNVPANSRIGYRVKWPNDKIGLIDRSGDNDDMTTDDNGMISTTVFITGGSATPYGFMEGTYRLYDFRLLASDYPAVSNFDQQQTIPGDYTFVVNAKALTNITQNPTPNPTNVKNTTGIDFNITTALFVFGLMGILLLIRNAITR